jgi:uncharacterized protein YvpB
MKLKVPLYSQRDTRWKNEILGYNTNPIYTIGGWGCLISSFAMYLTALGKNKNPHDVNEDMKSCGGYVSGTGNLIWSKIASYYNIVNDYQSPYYNGPVTDYGIQKIKDSLDQGKVCITHVDMDMNDADDDQHWIVIKGYEGEKMYANDPWTGTEIDLEVYGGPKRAIIEFRTYIPTVAKEETPSTPCEQSLSECQKNLDQERTWKNETWHELQDVKTELEGLNSQLISFQNFQKQLAITLRTEDQPTAILGAITKLIAVEDNLRKAQQKITELESAVQNCNNLYDEEHQKLLTSISEKEAVLEASQALEEARKRTEKALEDMVKKYEDSEFNLKQCLLSENHESLFKIGKLSICKINEEVEI